MGVNIFASVAISFFPLILPDHLAGQCNDFNIDLTALYFYAKSGVSG
jgi:hypothetical protein